MSDSQETTDIFAARQDLINRLVVWFSVFLAAPLYFSVSRAAQTGWLPIYGVHITLYTLILLTTLFRHRLAANFKAGVLITACFVIAVMGHYSFGLMAGGVFYLPIAVAILAFYFKTRVIVMFGIAIVTTMIAIAYGYVSERLVVVTDISILQRSAPQWSNYILSMIVFVVMTSFIMRANQAIFQGMINRISAQKDEIVRLTHFDQLTGVATLPLAIEYIGESMKQAAASDEQGALLLVGIGEIKFINDKFGYDIGDLVLRSVSERLLLLLRPEEKLARVGGGSYLIVAGKTKDQNRALFLADMIIDSLKKPIRTGTENLQIDCTIGICWFPNPAYNSPLQLINRVKDARLQAEREQTKVCVLS